MVAVVYGKKGIEVRCLYLVLSWMWWVLTGFGLFGRGAVVVLCYHQVTAIDRPRYQWQMQRIRNRTISAGAIGSSFARFRFFSLPRVCVTFDDGYANMAQGVFPIAKGLGIPITVFAVTGNMGQTPKWLSNGDPAGSVPLLSRSEIELAAGDPLCEFGSHTDTHPVLTEIGAEAAKQELQRSKQVLEDVLGHGVRSLAFPHGAYNDQVISMAREAGYDQMFSLDTWTRPTSTAGLIGRFSMSASVWKAEFLLTTFGAYSWLSPFRRVVRKIVKR